MVKAVGVDPGTRSFSIFGIEGEKVLLDVDVPSSLIAENPKEIIDIIRGIEPDVIAGPSGYGLPVMRVSELKDEELFLSILLKRNDYTLPVLKGVVEFLKLAKKFNLPMYTIPSVILLPTVPRYRKYNRIDMGTADKLAATVLAVYEQSKRLKIDYSDVSFILLELGGAYTSVVGVDSGVVVDGIGGSQGPLGFMSHGRMDGEVAYLLGSFSKELLFKGGAASIAGDSKISPEEFMVRVDREEKFREAYTLLVEEAVKFVLALTASVEKPREIIVSGRLTEFNRLVRDLEYKLKRVAPVRVLEGFKAKAKTPAQGAALIAEGIGGGVMEELIEHMKIREARGTVLDYVLFENWREIVSEASGLPNILT